MDDLKLNVEESWTEFLSAQKQLEFYREAIEYNKMTRTAYEEQFIMGQRSLLDVLDAENELFNSSTQAATALGNTLIAAYRMKALAGDLLPTFNISPERLKVTPNDHEPLDHLTMPEEGMPSAGIGGGGHLPVPVRRGSAGKGFFEG